ncbi:MAG: hypothetical protein AB8G96_04790, partial [Phycisphaerales bacterium]
VPVAPRPPGIVSDAVAAIEASLSDADWARDESAMDAIEVASLFAGNLQLAGRARTTVVSARELQWTTADSSGGPSSAPRSLQVLIVDAGDAETAVALAEAMDAQQARRIGSFVAALQEEAGGAGSADGVIFGRQGQIAGPDSGQVDPDARDTVRIWRRALRLSDAGEVRLIELSVATSGRLMIRFATDGRVFRADAPDQAMNDIMSGVGVGG